MSNRTMAVLEAAAPVAHFVQDKWHDWGPGLSGMLFGAGWWFFVDAVAIAPSHTPFSQYLPGLIATLTLILINSVRRDEILGTDAFGDEGVYCRARGWLLFAYMLACLSIGGSVLVMLGHYSMQDERDRWPGVASIFQVSCILGSALMFFVSRSPGENGGYDSFAY